MKAIKEVREYVIAFITIMLAMDHFGWFDRFGGPTEIAEELAPTAEELPQAVMFMEVADMGPDPAVIIGALVGATIAVGWTLKKIWRSL